MANLIPSLMPKEIHSAKYTSLFCLFVDSAFFSTKLNRLLNSFQILIPAKWMKSDHNSGLNFKPICIHLAGTGDHVSNFRFIKFQEWPVIFWYLTEYFKFIVVELFHIVFKLGCIFFWKRTFGVDVNLLLNHWLTITRLVRSFWKIHFTAHENRLDNCELVRRLNRLICLHLKKFL